MSNCKQTNNEPQDFDDMVFHNMIGWRDRSNRIEIERDALRAENARLREALENSAIMIQGCYDAPTNPDSLPQMLLHYIRAALEVKP
jgi:hypothetical protein